MEPNIRFQIKCFSKNLIIPKGFTSSVDNGYHFLIDVSLCRKRNLLHQIVVLTSVSLDMAEIIAIDLSLINKVLPTEILKKILKYLDHKTLALAKETCKRWNEIINGFELLEQAMSEFLRFCTITKL